MITWHFGDRRQGVGVGRENELSAVVRRAKPRPAHIERNNRAEIGRSIAAPLQGKERSQRKELLLPLPVGELFAEG